MDACGCVHSVMCQKVVAILTVFLYDEPQLFHIDKLQFDLERRRHNCPYLEDCSTNNAVTISWMYSIDRLDIMRSRWQAASIKCGPVMAQTLSICKSGRALRNTFKVTSPIRCSKRDMGKESCFLQPLLGHHALLPFRVAEFLYSCSREALHKFLRNWHSEGKLSLSAASLNRLSAWCERAHKTLTVSPGLRRTVSLIPEYALSIELIQSYQVSSSSIGIESTLNFSFCPLLECNLSFGSKPLLPPGDEEDVLVLTRSVRLDNATNLLELDVCGSSNPELRTITIESQQQVNKRLLSFLAASRRSLCCSPSLNFTLAACRRCHSDSICVGPRPPESFSISTRAQRTLQVCKHSPSTDSKIFVIKTL
uniref:Uncharacterized protein n=1 Tax=Glossina pallidipes TaxID=7398 RepID=A0A1A9ZQE8_GLOPL